MLVDLHTHSTFSDGRYTPTMLVEEAAARGISVLALTDHDSCKGIPEAQEALAKIGAKMRIITGVEISTQFADDDVHILGYHVDTQCRALCEKMHEMRHVREIRLYAMLKKLADLGYHVEVEVRDSKNRAVGRPHVAKALVAKGYFKTVQDVFDVLLHRGGPAYVPQPKLSPQEAVDLIHKAGGIAVLAHPCELKDSQLAERLLSEIPFDGIEVYHPTADLEARQRILALAEKHNVLISGGSDFHGTEDRYPPNLGIWEVNYDDVKGVIEWK